MNNFIKTLSFIFLFIFHHSLYAAEVDYTIKQDNEERKQLIDGYCKPYDVPTPINAYIILFVYGNTPQCEAQTFRRDEIAGKNLENFNLNGCQFININMDGTKLDGATLSNTTCCYQPPVLSEDKNKNQVRSECCGLILKEISEKYYPMLKKDADKARLLHIFSGLYYSTKHYEEGSTACNISLAYWYFNWLSFYQFLQFEGRSDHGFDYTLEKECREQSWGADIPTYVIGLKKAPHTNFDKYLSSFNECVKVFCFGPLTPYKPGRLQSNLPIEDNNYYVFYIAKTIKYLKKAYPKIKEQALQEEAVDIAYGLSESYKFDKRRLLRHYISYQYRLVKLNQKVGVEAKNYIVYQGMKNDFLKPINQYKKQVI